MASFETILGHEVSINAMNNLSGAAGDRIVELVQALKDGKVPGQNLEGGERVTVVMSKAAADWWKQSPSEHPAPPKPKPEAEPTAPMPNDDELSQVSFLCSDPNPIVRRFIVHDLMLRPEVPKPCTVRANHRAKDYQTSKRWLYNVDGHGMLSVATNGAIEHHEAKERQAKATYAQQLEETRMAELARLNAEARAKQNEARTRRDIAQLEQKAIVFESAGASAEAKKARAKAEELRKGMP
jgi:hypothetical protein